MPAEWNEEEGGKKAHKPLRTLEAELVLAAWKVELAATVKADGALLLEVVKRSHCLQKEGGKGGKNVEWRPANTS